jgi:hypothetical protein
MLRVAFSGGSGVRGGVMATTTFVSVVCAQAAPWKAATLVTATNRRAKDPGRRIGIFEVSEGSSGERIGGN